MRHAPRDRGREHFGIVHRWVEESVCDTRQHPAIEHESLPNPSAINDEASGSSRA
jgi:hypothetical protein